MGGMTPHARTVVRRGVHRVGVCTVCKRGIFSDQAWVQMRGPATGKNHADCVPGVPEVPDAKA